MSQSTPALRQPFTAEEKAAYGSIFNDFDKEGLGIITGEVARPVFEKSGLSTTTLRDIWQLVDTEGNGFLTEFAFFASLRLIGHCQNGAKPSLDLIQLQGPIAKLTPVTAMNTGSRQVSFQNTGTTPQGAVFPPLTPQDVSKFGQLFQKTAPAGILNGDQAKAIFLKANLPTPVLGQIWNLVDRQQSGRLSQQEFVMAMYLIQNTINGSLKQIPQFVPPAIWEIAGSGPGSSTASPRAAPPSINRTPSMQRQPSVNNTGVPDWTVTPAQKAQYDSIFDNLDKSKQGLLSPNEVAAFLMTSKLPQDTLGAIWDLADVENSGEFTKREFAIALYLVNRSIAGGSLPNIVPESLIHSAESPVAQAAPVAPSSHQKAPPSSINDLASLNDLFSSPVVTPPAVHSTIPAPAAEPVRPQVTASFTGSRAPFVPSSSFGQQIASDQAKSAEPPSLLEESGESDDDDEGPVSAEPNRGYQRPTIPARDQKPHFTGEAAPAANYSAVSEFTQQPAAQASAFSSQPNATPFPPPVSRAVPSTNNDLLADAEVSGQLSSATTDIANISNQINSLTSQTTQLNEKRERANNELTRILALKKDIESKLTKLRVLYEQEVQQVQEVESVLAQSKRETDNLQKEKDLTEANYHATQAKLQQLQVQYEGSQKDIEVLKDKLGVLNAENIELNNQHEQLITKQKQNESMLSVTQQQVNVAQTKNDELRAQLAQTDKEVSQVENEHESARSKLESLKAEIPMLTAAISAAAATVAMTKSALRGTKSSIEFQSQQKKDLEEKHAAIQKEQQSSQAEDVPVTVGNVEDTAAETAVATPTEEDKEGELSSKLKDLSVDSPASNTQAASSIPNTTETPASSEPGSDFQYQQQYQNFSLPLDRPQSTTSSVANNAPLSVRGEENVSEPASPSSGEEAATPTTTIDSQQQAASEETVESNRGNSQNSSTGESFELVEAEQGDVETLERPDTPEPVTSSVADETETAAPSSSSLTVKDLDAAEGEESQLSTIPGAFVSTPAANEEPSALPPASSTTEEFPPIKELEYDESSSSDEEDESAPKEEKFDDAVDTLPEPTATANDEFDDLEPAVEEEPSLQRDEFDDLEPASVEQGAGGDDLFDEFADLEEAAPEDTQVVSAFEDAQDGFNQGFTDSTTVDKNDLFNSFDNLEPTTADNNDEWEQLFEGFGNAAPAPEIAANPAAPEEPQNGQPAQDSLGHELAIEELTGMGFDRAAVIEALEKENWNSVDATNRLLDSA